MGLDIIKITGIALTGCILSVLIKKYLPNQSMLTAIITGIVLLLMAVEGIKPILDMVSELFSETGIHTEYGKSVLQAIGICIIAGFAVDSCRDAGENALANKVELACKIIITTMALPMFRDLISMARKMIKG